MPAMQLVQLTQEELRGLADGQAAAHFAAAPADALPPPHVAARALAQLANGTPAFWCAPFIMREQASGAVLGGCTFKGVPDQGTVEIAYGVAESARGKGIATAAVAQLLDLAAKSGMVQQVLAHIVPENIASIKVVSRLGFQGGAPFLEDDGDTVQRWAYPI